MSGKPIPQRRMTSRSAAKLLPSDLGRAWKAAWIEAGLAPLSLGMSIVRRWIVNWVIARIGWH